MVNRAAAALGRKGGKKTGATKRRGDSEHYRALAAKSAEARARVQAKMRLDCGRPHPQPYCICLACNPSAE